MAITNQQIFNGCLAGIAGAQVNTVPLSTVDNSAAINAAALAAEANIAGVVGALGGGGSPQQMELAEALCYAAFANRRCTDTVQANYSGDVAGLGTYFQAVSGKISGTSGTTKIKAVVVPAILAGASTIVTVTDAAFIGGNTFAAYLPSPPTQGGTTITSINAFPNTAGAPNPGAVDLLFFSAPGTPGETINITIVVTS